MILIMIEVAQSSPPPIPPPGSPVQNGGAAAHLVHNFRQPCRTFMSLSHLDTCKTPSPHDRSHGSLLGHIWKAFLKGVLRVLLLVVHFCHLYLRGHKTLQADLALQGHARRIVRELRVAVLRVFCCSLCRVGAFSVRFTPVGSAHSVCKTRS